MLVFGTRSIRPHGSPLSLSLSLTLPPIPFSLRNTRRSIIIRVLHVRVRVCLNNIMSALVCVNARAHGIALNRERAQRIEMCAQTHTDAYRRTSAGVQPV
jgi:hypothetical protein